MKWKERQKTKNPPVVAVGECVGMSRKAVAVWMFILKLLLTYELGSFFFPSSFSFSLQTLQFSSAQLITLELDRLQTDKWLEWLNDEEEESNIISITLVTP